jgi:hypothetical protein
VRRGCTAALLLICLAGPIGVLAQNVSQATHVVPAPTDQRTPPQTLILSKSAEAEARRLAVSLGKAKSLELQQPPTQRRSWISRHPTLFGALVGAGAGAASSVVGVGELYCASGSDEDCLFYGASGVLFGAGLGAGVGALVGHFVGK